MKGSGNVSVVPQLIRDCKVLTLILPQFLVLRTSRPHPSLIMIHRYYGAVHYLWLIVFGASFMLGCLEIYIRCFS